MGLYLSDLPICDGMSDLLVAIEANKGLRDEALERVEKISILNSKLEEISSFPAENMLPVMRIDAQGFLVYANQAANSILENWGMQQGDKVPVEYYELVRDVKSNGTKSVEIEVDEFVYKITFTQVAGKEYVNIYCADISAEKQQFLQLLKLSRYDALTNVANRRFFGEILEKAIALAKRREYQVAVLFLDLDNFKSINDMLGHGVGDKVLQSVALKVDHVIRESDTVARLGG
jgi:predicted signal transduction protein with EAL and GGDEF domain